jgi:hypothetical protein
LDQYDFKNAFIDLITIKVMNEINTILIIIKIISAGVMFIEIKLYKLFNSMSILSRFQLLILENYA